MRTWKSTLAILACVPLVLAASCGGGGGGGDGATSSTGSDQQSDTMPASTTSAITNVPLAGTLLADCSDTGVGLVDSAIDAVNGIAGDSLPASLPKLSDVVAQADLENLPLLGGIVQDALGQLESLSATDVSALLPLGVPGLADLPVPSQLPAICTQLVGTVPLETLNDPSALLALLGDPSHTLGVIGFFDDAGNPLGSLLVTVPNSLVPGSGSSSLPELTSLAPLDPSTLPLVGGTLSDLVTTLLGLLDTNSLLGGTPLSGLLAGLIP